MPSKGERLTPDEVGALREWIKAGAIWPTWDPASHWAFRSLSRPQPPAPSNPHWVRNEVDAFVSAKLGEHQLQPMPEADRRTLARWWLDLARYADSNGYQVDLARSNWPYRDWVINAFNQNMPFDQFTIEQLAGRPAMGSWFSYGLGSENKDLPAYVVLMTGVGQPLTESAWGSGFLPTTH
jgi:hypothetical protein